jgi:hypothetical protein
MIRRARNRARCRYFGPGGLPVNRRIGTTPFPSINNPASFLRIGVCRETIAVGILWKRAGLGHEH